MVRRSLTMLNQLQWLFAFAFDELEESEDAYFKAIACTRKLCPQQYWVTQQPTLCIKLRPTSCYTQTYKRNVVPHNPIVFSG